jgi:IPT/TIG domain-containing protein
MRSGSTKKIPGVPFHHQRAWRILGLAAALLVLATMVLAQGSPRIISVEPAAGKVNDTVTVTGENLGKESVAAFLLSDEKTDYKAALTEQAAGKVVFKVPQVKAGDYNVSIQVGNNILIQPVRFKVQE